MLTDFPPVSVYKFLYFRRVSRIFSYRDFARKQEKLIPFIDRRSYEDRREDIAQDFTRM